MVGQEVGRSADIYHTQFLEQVVVDRDESAQQVHFFNLTGSSYASSFQVELGIEVLNGLDVKAAYSGT